MDIDTIKTAADRYEAARDEGVYHPFEKAGLGVAPFHTVNIFWSGIVQSCDFCSTAITQICVIGDSCGRTFKVGNVCVEQTGDEGLIKEMRRLLRKAKHKKDDERVGAARVKLEDKIVRDGLSAQPHPNTYRASQGGTLLTYVEWLLENAGRSGCVKAAKIIESQESLIK